ncbi:MULTISPECIES: sulfite exporter TauE/SafE family protein [Xanthobacteraceae]|uniref:sulfite exporter TauE/SafE family protein n=1 Tax=Xanthobacteraceae TaxID=335928 RepID=UPI000BC681BE|nr:MAG: hypothetical protein B7Y61_00205 [Rhizobiales bacterium 35-66-30]OYZ77431.1 MAG: hypothetical protein B7Y12_10520 [Rhizobiales bacterium 24-66-13]OZB12139.1 MAG: hypothetical protein B7X67_00445 [Rhizobiales bacterium 39-66-18]
MSEAVFLALGTGALIGFTLGLIGGGGSILATPLLLYVVGVSNPHVAIGTGALAVSVNAYINLIVHARNGHIWWRCAILFALVGTIGALAGSTLGKAIDGQHLLFLFGLLMMVVGALMLRPRKNEGGSPRRVDWRMCTVTGIVALIAGGVSVFFGIGGGFLIVPGLILATGMPTISAIGSSLLAVGTFGLATAINYAATGLVDWTIATEFIVGGIAGGAIGTFASTYLASRKDLLNRIFAGLIFVVAAYVIYRSSGSVG